MKRYYTLIVVSLCSAIGIVFAQNNNMAQNPATQVFQSSPDAAALGRYGDYPVSLTTGLIDISVPLFEIGTKRIKLPITLSYHSSGITVDEIASSAGLGWVLNAGGCITVTVQDKEDISYRGGSLSNNFKNPNFLTTDEINALPDNQEKLEKLNWLFETNELDKESDIYSYNFNGHSGQFRYEAKYGNIIPLTKDGLKIAHKDPHNITNGYEITTDEGIVYTFDKKEYAKINSSSSSYVCAYYLTKIKDLMNGDEINFTYSKFGADNAASPYAYTYYPNHSFVDNCRASNTTPLNTSNCYGGSNCTVGYSFYTYTSIERTSGVYALSEISSPQGNVKITLSDDRQDKHPHRISEIKLYNKQSPNTAIKTVNFQHSYFLSDSYSTNDDDNEDRYKKRLCLVIGAIQIV